MAALLEVELSVDPRSELLMLQPPSGERVDSLCHNVNGLFAFGRGHVFCVA